MDIKGIVERLSILSTTTIFVKLNDVQNAYPRGGAPEPGINDDFIYPRTRCPNPEDDRYYDPRCFTFDGSGTHTK